MAEEPKPQVGSVAPVIVQPAAKHPLVIITSIAAGASVLAATCIQLGAIPGLPTNIVAWLGTGAAILTAIATILRQIGALGTPSVSPTAAAKLIQTEAPKQ